MPGVGLGLTITKAIAAAHGGALRVSSIEGVGTTFSLLLPVDGITVDRHTFGGHSPGAHEH